MYVILIPDTTLQLPGRRNVYKQRLWRGRGRLQRGRHDVSLREQLYTAPYVQRSQHD